MSSNDAKGPDCWKCSLNVEWHDCSFCPVIELRRGILRRNGANTKPSAAPTLLPDPFRRKNLFKPMRTKLLGIRFPKRNAFTLVELLTVIAIIGILAAMLLPVLATVSKHAKMTKARLEINDLVTDIQAYDQAYGRFPVSHAAQAAAALTGAQNGNYDFTYGGTFSTVLIGTQVPRPGSNIILSNNEVVSILMDYTNFPGTTTATVNTNHQSNPQGTKFLNAKMSGWNPTLPNQVGPPPGGVDAMLTYRDPWGNPYIISMDLNYDDQCQDSFYCLQNVSWTQTGTSGYNGLSCPSSTVGDNFQFHGKVMVWSAGPDGKVDKTTAANKGYNKDNILSWQ
jgi:prepilin-type N-terminal cleavage/methylation domain-containing protein